jgi:small subunit ribosomal protein S6
MNAGSNLIAELERRFRNNDSVIKFLSVRMDEQAKAADRQKVRYEREGKRKAQAGIKDRSPEEVMG